MSFFEKIACKRNSPVTGYPCLLFLRRSLFCDFSKDGKVTKRSLPIGMQPHRLLPLANRHGPRTQRQGSLLPYALYSYSLNVMAVIPPN